MNNKGENLPKVSVVIPTYNTAKYTVTAVESVFAQTIQDFEIVLVDDGSDSESANLLANLASHNKVRLLRLEENQGVAKARRHGWELAKGKYVSSLDSDDQYEKEYLEQCLMCFEKKPEYGAVYTRYVWISEDGKFGKIQPESGYSGWIFSHEIKKSSVKTSTLMVRRKHLLMLAGLLEYLRRGENYDMILRLCYKYQFGFIDQTLVKVMARQGSVSRSGVKSRLNRIEILESILSSYSDMDSSAKRRVQRKLASYCTKQGEFFVEEGKKHEARTFFRKSWRYVRTLRALSRYFKSFVIPLPFKNF